MYYTIRHTTRYRYSGPISQNIMEVRMHPRSDGNQTCLDFRLRTSPRASILAYRDGAGNRVEHFDIPNSHTQLSIIAESLVDVRPPGDVPDALATIAWETLDAQTAHEDFWEMLTPSRYTQSNQLLTELAQELDIRRRDDPLTLLREVNWAIYRDFDYSTQSTRVDSPIEEALQQRKGVCQDFTHIMLALMRPLGIPCRYVSGYLCTQANTQERVSDAAMHAWVEAYLPELGWVGFDPTNNMLASDHHIRVAVGRDYADAAPTRGVFMGKATSELSVVVRVSLTPGPFIEQLTTDDNSWHVTAQDDREQDEKAAENIQQQQQQQQA